MSGSNELAFALPHGAIECMHTAGATQSLHTNERQGRGPLACIAVAPLGVQAH